MYSKAKKGRYDPINPEKYLGDPTTIWFRSGMELRLYKFLDRQPAILQWAVEEFCIDYVDPIKQKQRRYYPDALVVYKDGKGERRTMVIEVKSRSETIEPRRPGKMTAAYLNKVSTWVTNNAKWRSAQYFCEKKNWEFRVITEDQLGLGR